MRAPLKSTESNMIENIKRLWVAVGRKKRMQVTLSLFLMFIASIGEVVSLGLVIPFLGVLTSPQIVFEYQVIKPALIFFGLTEPQQLLLPVTIIFIAAALLSGALRLLLLFFQTRLGHLIGTQVSLELYKRALNQPYAFHVSRNSSELIASISQKVNEVVYQIVISGLVLLSSIFFSIVILGTLIVIQPVVALICIIAFGIIYGALIYVTKSKLLHNSSKISRLTSERIKVLQEGLGGIRDVIIDGTQQFHCQKYHKVDSPLRAAQASNQFISSSPRFYVESLGMALIAILAYFQVSAGTSLETLIPILGAFALGAQRLLPMLQQAYASWSNMRGGSVALTDVVLLMQLPIPNTTQSLPKFDFKSMKADGLDFSYDSAREPVLKDIEFQINKGDRVGIVGATGSGKSTLIDIVMGLLKPTRGHLLVNETSLDLSNYSAWRENIAHVPQSIYLSDASIAENIAFGVSQEKIDYERVIQSAQLAMISDTIEELDDKYKTIVGERGVRFSGGQCQRIGIARALYKRASVIILDEATSALDAKTEAEVMKSLASIGSDVTLIIIAHRFSTLESCNKIFQVKEGRLHSLGAYSPGRLEAYGND